MDDAQQSSTESFFSSSPPLFIPHAPPSTLNARISAVLESFEEKEERLIRLCYDRSQWEKGTPPTPSEIARKLGMSVGTFSEARSAALYELRQALSSDDVQQLLNGRWSSQEHVPHSRRSHRLPNRRTPGHRPASVRNARRSALGELLPSSETVVSASLPSESEGAEQPLTTIPMSCDPDPEIVILDRLVKSSGGTYTVYGREWITRSAFLGTRGNSLNVRARFDQCVQGPCVSRISATYKNQAVTLYALRDLERAYSF